MKKIQISILLTICAFLSGCHIFPSRTIDSIDAMDPKRGYLALRFESNWKHPNDSYLGRQLSLLFGTGAMTGGNIPLTSPDSLKILPLKPGSYWLSLGMIDHSISFDDKLRFEIKPGEVTNLGSVFFDIGYSANGNHFWRISGINQSSFSELEGEIRDRSSATELLVKSQSLLKQSQIISAYSTGGGSFSVSYELSK